MKKLYYVSGISIVCIVVATIFYLNANNSLKKDEFSDLLIANVEALASDESGGGQPMNCYSTVENSNDGRPVETVTYCGDCKAVRCTNWSNSGRCMR